VGDTKTITSAKRLWRAAIHRRFCAADACRAVDPAAKHSLPVGIESGNKFPHSKALENDSKCTRHDVAAVRRRGWSTRLSGRDRQTHDFAR
jgi:hypothetical protein